MAQHLSERQQRAAERILEDESLTEDLTDKPARALITWASEQASILAGEAERSDEQLAAALKHLRTAVRAAAASGEEEPTALVAQAQAALDQALGQAAPQPQATSSQQAPAPAPTTAQPEAATQPANQGEQLPHSPEQKSTIEEVHLTEGGKKSAENTPAAQEEETPTEQLSDEERYARWLEGVEQDEQE